MEFDLQIVNRHFPSLSESQRRQLNQFSELIAEWNEKVNLVSRNDVQNLPIRHILHSLAIAKTVDFQPGTRILDVGTGGGFPGIPLAILYPECQFQLIDSIGKKIRAVANCIESLGLKNANARQIRASAVEEAFDFVVARAVTQLPKFIQWVRGSIRHPSFNPLENGVLYLKGGDLAEEFADLIEKPTLYPIINYFNYPEFDRKFVVHVPLPEKRCSELKNRAYQN